MRSNYSTQTKRIHKTLDKAIQTIDDQIKIIDNGLMQLEYKSLSNDLLVLRTYLATKREKIEAKTEDEYREFTMELIKLVSEITLRQFRQFLKSKGV